MVFKNLTIVWGIFCVRVFCLGKGILYAISYMYQNTVPHYNGTQMNLCNLNESLATILPQSLRNFRAIGQYYHKAYGISEQLVNSKTQILCLKFF